MFGNILHQDQHEKAAIERVADCAGAFADDEPPRWMKNSVVVKQG
jgi:hypothetical protein